MVRVHTPKLGVFLSRLAVGELQAAALGRCARDQLQDAQVGIFGCEGPERESKVEALRLRTGCYLLTWAFRFWLLHWLVRAPSQPFQNLAILHKPFTKLLVLDLLNRL